MILMPLGIAALVGSLITFVYTQNNGGADATATVSDHVLTGSMLYAIAAFLFVAGALFVVSAVVKAIRRFAALAATLALVTGGGIGALVPDSVSSYVNDHCQAASAQSVKHAEICSNN